MSPDVFYNDGSIKSIVCVGYGRLRFAKMIHIHELVTVFEMDDIEHSRVLKHLVVKQSCDVQHSSDLYIYIYFYYFHIYHGAPIQLTVLKARLLLPSSSCAAATQQVDERASNSCGLRSRLSIERLVWETGQLTIHLVCQNDILISKVCCEKQVRRNHTTRSKCIVISSWVSSSCGFGFL